MADQVRRERVDVDAILASLPPEFDDPGEDRWGGANLEPWCDGSASCPANYHDPGCTGIGYGRD